MRFQAVALCRVSTAEQLSNNSLNRQGQSVQKAAESLGVDIVKIISGDVSSKVGKNFNRPDLMEAFEFCRSNKKIKYLIVDEVDRFMRSTAEMFYWMTKLKEEASAQVYFASNPELNTNDARARLLLSLDGFKAEGSNEERQKKSINGHLTALKEGRYTFPAKPGYQKGSSTGIHEPHATLFKPLQKAFREVASGIYSPQEALKRLNASSFTRYHAAWNFDKFRTYLTDPYYAGIVEINKQVVHRNENGLHVPMITKEEHRQILNTLDGTLKRRGSKKHYNPELPMNKHMWCEDCGQETLFTGGRKNNGYQKKITRYYYKYRCRGCGNEYDRDRVHQQITETLAAIKYTDAQRDEFVDALRTVWQERHRDSYQQAKSLRDRVNQLNTKKSAAIIEMSTSPIEYKEDFTLAINDLKIEISKLEKTISELENVDEDLPDFIEFGLNYSSELKNDWWELGNEERTWCKQLFFKGGISYNALGKVCTHDLTSIYRLVTKEKEPQMALKSRMVELPGIAPGSEK